MNDVVNYKLSDRPDWWLPKLLKWGSMGLAILVVLMGVLSFILHRIDSYALNPDADEENLVFINFAEFASELAWASIDILFYVVVFWLLSLAVDKIDQLVWLNATYEDRKEIISKRMKKKNAKNK
jgi:uncharacterized membrane protein YbhN (UPF0104 family)